MRLSMCHKCAEIDEQIARFRDLARSVHDPKTLKSIEILIAELEARKDALHPERQQ
jgi:hypothetical protein